MPELVPIRVAFLLFPNVTQLDLTGPAQVLSRLGNATIDLVARTRDPVMSDAGFALLPTATFDDAIQPDLLCVPGGLGVNDAMEDDATIAWVRQAAAGAQWITSVCTGSLLLGAAGLLSGYRATCHWASHDLLAAFGAIPVKERVVFDRNRATGGGVTAGIDFGLALVAAIRGEAQARLVQLTLEYDPAPPFDSGTPTSATPETLARYERLAGEGLAARAERTRAVAAKLSGASYP
ncbi:thiamine biosynthesis protein ThiJ [Sphingomonas sp. Leaf357]|uniref:DJ-1/PfpI family protein n=1 Tax=Sphingomonas sp. Leaf357 TaxID=1736350 RepID=UPI0006F47261|nr:DJ-1/PfpI family protein [Sphingomonas sp. Leaf357]KQS02141.1 thiamine biosynthesis protein ThiJ [Sphingomonas sp. Leaf357]